MSEGAIAPPPDVNQATTSESASAASSTAQPTASPSSADVNTQAVQDSQPPQTDDPLANFPPDEELQAAVANKTPFAEMAARIKGAYEPLKTKYSELESKYSIFADAADKFSAPEEVQSLVQMRESLLGWEQNDRGELVPSTQKFVEALEPRRADFLFADLADGMTTDQSGQPISRIDKVLQYVAANPENRANALKILGAVEPSAVAPQWQPTPEELQVVREDLQDTYKKLPYDKRESLKLNDPDFINDYLNTQKLQNDLIQEREQRAQRDQYEAQQRQEMLQAEASRAGDDYVRTQLGSALSTLKNSVVEQCNFIEPIDPANPPQGMDAQSVAEFNNQAQQVNRSEAAVTTLAAVALVNPEVREWAVPLLKEAGLIDDKFLQELDAAATGFGDNARNYGKLAHVGQLQANGKGYQPPQDVVGLKNNADRNLKLLAYNANQVVKKLVESKSRAFGMKATGYNQILKSGSAVRPSANGSSYDPTKAAPQLPTGWMSKAEIDQQFGG